MSSFMCEIWKKELMLRLYTYSRYISDCIIKTDIKTELYRGIY